MSTETQSIQELSTILFNTHDTKEALDAIARKADVNCTTSDFYTPLHKHAAGGRVEVVKALIAAGANIEYQSDSQMTPLISAVVAGEKACVKALLDAGAKTDVLVHAEANPHMGWVSGPATDAKAIAKIMGFDDIARLIEKTEKKRQSVAQDCANQKSGEQKTQFKFRLF